MRSLLFAASALAICVSRVHAVAFNDVRPDARATGMGTAFAAIADDAFGMYYNPAGTANAPYLTGAGSIGRFASPVGTLTQASGAYVRPYEPINTATIGASYHLERQTHGGDTDTMLFNYAQEYKVNEIPLSKPLRIGANFKFINVDRGSGGKDGFGMGFDMGALARTDMGLNFGLALTDITNYVGLPRAGLTMATAYTWEHRITFAGDFRVHGGLAEFFPGVEVTLLQGLLKARAGKGLSLDGVSTIAFGLGVNFSPVVLDIAMSLPPSGINQSGGGYEATLTYRFGAPSFAGQFIGSAAAEAERLRNEVINLEERRKTLQTETGVAETERSVVDGELRVLERRQAEAQDAYRVLLKRNAELSYEAQERAAGLGEGPKPVALPKPPPVPMSALWPKTHVVVEGETLRSLALKYYGDSNLWERIYDANGDKVDRGIPEPGATLTIPAPPSKD